MKTLLAITSVICLIMAGAIGYLVNQQPIEHPESFGRAYSGAVTNSATTTTSALPVKIFSTNGARSYARIQNISDTAVFLHFGYFASADTASTTVDVDEGIRLNTVGTVGSVYEITDNNLYLGQVWATSTAGSKELIYIEK